MPKVLDVRVESALTIFHNGTDNLGELGLDVTEARREAHAYLKEKLNTLVIGHTLLRKYQSTYHF
ncbi:hypothetical protein HYS31_03240 [Candidatus Woesearchaeota archaeon]|nr:hypothetical protein [Candidatus Woesearchaeota archaeon]